MTYFKPLLNWLVTENVRHGEILGWPDFSCTFEGLIMTLVLALVQPQALPWARSHPNPTLTPNLSTTWLEQVTALLLHGPVCT